MSAVLPSKESLERDWLSFEQPAQLSLQEKLARTTSVSTLTHVRMPDGLAVEPDQFITTYGFSYEAWRGMRAELERCPAGPATTFCELGGIALTLEAFEAGHENINLAQE